MQKKEVVFIVDNFNGGGAERVILTLCEEWNRKGFDISAITLTETPITYTVPDYIKVYKTENLDEKFGYKKVGEYRKRFEFYKRTLKFFGRITGKKNFHPWKNSRFEMMAAHSMPIRCYLDGHKDAVAIAFLNLSVAATLLIANKVKNRVVFSERNDPRSLTGPLREMIDNNYMHASFGVFQTNNASDYYSELKNKAVILNPLRQNLPDAFHGERRKEFVSIGRFHEQKNHDLVIRAFKRIHDKHSDFKLALYGHGPDEEKIKKLISDLSLSDSVIMRPFCEDVLEKIRDSYAYVNSSNYEGLCNAMLESMAIGLPVICTDCPVGGAAMMIENEVNGMLVPVGDETAMANAMERLITDPGLAERLSKNSVAVRDMCRADAIVSKWESVI